jgi:DNA-binding response OmpR family regulator
MASRPLVLIVDDNPDILVLLRTNLRAAGFETIEAQNGRVALEKIEEQSPDVVLLDLMMPIMDGWAVLEDLQRRPEHPPVIVVSALDAPASAERARGLGVAAYITKPFNVSNLVELIRSVLSGERPEPPGTDDESGSGP